MNIVSETIFLQLGGRKFVTMTGAKNFLGGENYLQFDLPPSITKRGCNKFAITLQSNDLYTVESLKYSKRTLSVRTMEKHEDISVDILLSTFTTMTGLLVRL